MAAEIIQKYLRGFLWRCAEARRQEREARIAKERNTRHVRRRQMERGYWWDSEVRRSRQRAWGRAWRRLPQRAHRGTQPAPAPTGPPAIFKEPLKGTPAIASGNSCFFFLLRLLPQAD